MAKILLTIAGLLMLAFIVIAIYCSLIIAGRSDDDKGNNNRDNNDEMFLKKQICPRCKTGKYNYELDPKSDACPYIGCWKKGKCSFFEPLDKHSKSRACKKGKSDDNVVIEKTYNMIQNSV